MLLLLLRRVALICAVGLTARRVLLLQPGQNIPPPVAMKRNPETGELEEFHSHKLQDDLPEEEVRKSNLQSAFWGGDVGNFCTRREGRCCSQAETAEIEVPVGDDY